MKSRKGYKIIDADGFGWLGDCARGMAEALAAGLTVQPIRIYGTRRWPCASCKHGLRH
ncbi:hypothetical protein [Streptomyces noursei]|uniref:hypothetical protein n=1 Tax=Streptomyces noursei TaxID=1971 RepID=UPI0023B87F77|nr:hypothetical protein [Streptomyces noursei]